MKPIFVVNGPNLNLLGEREPEIYGSATLADTAAALEELALELGLALDFRQSNHESILVDWIDEARDGASGLMINAAGYSHTSIAIREAVSTLAIPVIEVHFSNIYAREPFRHFSHLTPVSDASIVGLGVNGYLFALESLSRMITAEH